MSRFTVRDLRAAVDEVNGCLANAGALVRLEEHGRNGYQAIDEYSVNRAGMRIGSGVNCNVCCGTSREVAYAAWEYCAGHISGQCCND
jgi:hypothetical protein